MAGRLRGLFDELRGKRAALITYATGYYPDRGASSGVIRAMLECGADAVEIGLPFSDPVLDGKVIQESSRVALEAGANTPRILELAEELRAGTEKPIMLMSYYNPVFKYGLEGFARDAVEAGIDAAIIPDLPIEEMSPWKRECDSLFQGDISSMGRSGMMAASIPASTASLAKPSRPYLKTGL